MTRMLFAALAAIFAASAAEAAQAPDFSQAQVRVTDLGGRTYMLENWNMNVQTGGNMVAAIGTDSVILVDGNFAPMHDKIKAAVGSLSNQPIRFLINTHFHGDHTGGNAVFATQEMLTIVGHENLKKRLESGTTNGLSGARTEPAPAAALPKQVYADRTTVQSGGRTAQVTHPAGAHTDTDSYVYFADANVLATGDIVTFGRYPNIDFANGGNIDGMITAVDGYIQLANDTTKIVPGHGPLGTRAMLREYKDMLTTARARVARLIADGKTIDQAVAAKPNADYDMRYNMNEMAAGNFVRVIYRSLKPA